LPEYFGGAGGFGGGGNAAHRGAVPWSLSS
jgi:hypothetical protein